MTNEPIGWTVTWNLNDKHAFRNIAKETASAVREAEPETMVYEWCLSPDGKSVTLVEWFSGLSAAKAHLKGIAVTKYLPQLNEKAELTGIQAYGAFDDELRKMLAGLNAGINEQFTGFSRVSVAATV